MNFFFILVMKRFFSFLNSFMFGIRVLRISLVNERTKGMFETTTDKHVGFTFYIFIYFGKYGSGVESNGKALVSVGAEGQNACDDSLAGSSM